MARFKVNKKEVQKAWLEQHGIESLDDVLGLARFNAKGELTGFNKVEGQEEEETEEEISDDEFVPDDSQIEADEEKEETKEEDKQEKKETKEETSTLKKRFQKTEQKLPKGQKDLSDNWDKMLKDEIGG